MKVCAFFSAPSPIREPLADILQNQTNMPEFNFNDLIQDIADRKKRLAEKRFSTQEKNENPREVYLSVCKNIADYYEQYGFKYSASGQHMTLKTKGSEFIYKISFSSSHYNIADEYVAITVSANVLSHKFKKWQSENKIGHFNEVPSEYVGGGQIGNLQENSTWLKWNVANPLTRHTETENIIENINKFAIPFFNLFSDIPPLIHTIKECGSFYGISDVTSLTEFLMYASTKENVEATLKRFLSSKNIWKEYLEVLEKLRNKEKISGGQYWNSIAKLTIELELDLTENKNIS